MTSATHSDSLFLPPVNRSMKELDRSFFQRTIPLSIATVFDDKRIPDVQTSLRRSGELFERRPTKPLRNDGPLPGKKGWLLESGVRADDRSTWSPTLNQLVDDGLAQVSPFTLRLTYDDWNLSEVLDAILPEAAEEDKETPHSFAQAGHVAHVNLAPKFLPYKYLIGQLIIDKNPHIKTVINKTLDVGTENIFRTFPYEVLAGQDDLDVKVSHSGCTFRFNFGKVYWNTRLSTEHARTVDKFQPNEAICDVMAGVGPFAIPAGKKGCWVRANDLNPDCYAALCEAVKENKVQDLVVPWCRDGNEFIKLMVQKIRTSPRETVVRSRLRFKPGATDAEKVTWRQRVAQDKKVLREPTEFGHFVMNLPATAINFLPAFRGIYADRVAERGKLKMPMVHCYLFQRKLNDKMEEMGEEEEKREICQTLSAKLGVEIKLDDEKHELDLHYVRSVSPNKKMYCASFRLPEEVAFAQTELAMGSYVPFA